jgi:predicted phosphodiesterase
VNTSIIILNNDERKKMSKSPKEINLGELSDLIAEGPAGKEKQTKQAKAIRELSEALILMVKRIRPYEVPVESDEDTIKFGLIGDTHIGSGYQRTDALKAFYDACAAEGVKQVLHVGDVIDGWHVYRGQEFELHPNARSWPDQRDMFAALAPKHDGIETIFITGNHELSFRRSVGMVTGDELQRVRPDWKYIGADVGTAVLTTKRGKKFSVLMVHPGDRGGAYALSYKLQKFIEAIPGGQKPDLVALGHYHKACHLPNYRNVSGILAGCFQSQTPFMASQGAAAQVGGWIVSVTLGDPKKLTRRTRAEFVSFFEEARA